MMNAKGEKILMTKKPFNTWNYYVMNYTNQDFVGDGLWIEITRGKRDRTSVIAFSSK